MKNSKLLSYDWCLFVLKYKYKYLRFRTRYGQQKEEFQLFLCQQFFVERFRFSTNVYKLDELGSDCEFYFIPSSFFISEKVRLNGKIKGNFLGDFISKGLLFYSRFYVSIHANRAFEELKFHLKYFVLFMLTNLWI